MRNWRLLQTGEHFTGYTVGEKYLRGAHGVLYRAKSSDGRDVHLRIPSKELLAQPGGYDRFARQALAPVHVGHPALLRTLETRDPDDGPPFHVLERPAGYQRVVRLLAGRSEPYPAEAVFPLLRALAKVLDEARRAGFVCTELQAAGVFVRESPKGEPTLSPDLRLLTNFHPVELAPPASQTAKPPDQLALAQLTYLALTARPPEPAEGSESLARSPAPPSTYVRDLPPMLDGPLLSTLNREVASNYTTCAELVCVMEIIVQQWRDSGASAQTGSRTTALQ
jgi:hypothetical protein